MAKPFLKWAGGKGQLLAEISSRLPADIDDCTTYVEPFIGGGALLFHMLEHHSFETIHISDFNPELILCYRTIRDDVDSVVSHLRKLSEDYPAEQTKRAVMFYKERKKWNAKVGSAETAEGDAAAFRTAQTLFMNRTCFNGLFRVNSKGEYNVPVGSYVNPRILNEENLRAVSESLQDINIHVSSYEECESRVEDDAFVYFDPPYLPLSVSSSFTAYSRDGFGEEQQHELAALFRRLDKKGAKLMLSNSDPDHFSFDELYEGFTVKRVLASRNINSKGDGRGKINEILVTNY